MAHFRFPLSVGSDGKRTSTHVSVNPYAISFQTNDATPVVYDGHEAKFIDLTVLSVATAGKLTNARTIGISGAVTGTATNFDGTGNITIPTTAINVSKANAGTLAIARGGTGKTSWTAFGIVYASAKNTLGQLGVGTAGQVLQSGGSAAPSWIDQADLVVGEAGKLSNSRTILIDLASTTSASFDGTSNITPGISNTLPTTHGGTGKTAWDSYKIIYASGTNTLAQLDIGSEGEVLLSQGTGKAAKWENQQNLNVGTAAKFTTAKTITLTGDVTGTASSQAGWSITTTIGAGKVTNAMLAGSIANSKLVNSKITIAGNDVSLGGSLTAATLTSSLGLSNALHFIGITSTTLTDGSTTATLTAKSTNSLSKTTGFVDGDVVMDGDQLREYVWSGSAWRLLGITTSTAYTQPTSTATNTWIAQVSQGTDGKITATTGSLNTSGTWSGKANTAGTADKISNLVTTDQASSSNTWRRVWISYIDNVTGRPAWTDNLVFQTSTNTLKTTKFQGALIGNADSATTSTWTTLLKPIASTTTASASTWNIPSGSKQVWGERFSDSTLKYTPSGGSETTVTDTGDWTMWLTSGGTSNTATLNMRIDGTYYGSFSGNLSGNASTATKSGVAAIWLYSENNNEINFGGTHTGTILYFGYRAKDSRAIPTKFVFGSSTGTADLQAKTVYLGSGTSSYISSTQYTGNAATATTAANLANNPSIQASTSNTNQVTITAGGKTSSAYTIPYATSAGSATSATTATYIKCTDTRNTTLNPTDLTAAQGVRFDFKAKGTIDLTATDAYAGVMSFRPYASNTDWSGGNAHQLAFNSEGLHWRNGGASWGNWYRIWKQGDSVTSAVWNDYAEARESLCTEPGRAVQETGSDILALITERLAPCAGIISDTWGFSQGETDSAKTHIAVAGRVLAYPYRDRSEYKPGDVLCAAPGGTVDIMTREEIIQYPDRIVGTVSCVPDYDEWGGGEGADRPPAKVNGRIWIKVK